MLEDQPLLDKPRQNRRERANFISQLFFFWVYPTIQLAQKETLQADMIEDLQDDDRSAEIHSQFQQAFQSLKRSKYMLAKALLITFRNPTIVLFIILMLQIGSQLTMPLLIKYTIEFIMKEDKETSEGIWLIVGIFLVRCISIVATAHVRSIMTVLGYSTVSAICMEILNKSFKVSFLSNKKHSSGQVLTLMQVDASKLQAATIYLACVGLLPIQMIISIYLMFEFIGISFLGGLFVIFLTMVCNTYISKYMMKQIIISMGNKDVRTKCANEIFQQIKFIKINAFEQYFQDKLTKLRDTEVASIKKRLFANCLNILSVWLSPALILNATFGIYIWIGHDLTPSDTFAMISIFQILQIPLLMLPISINALIETNVSLKRLQEFLLADEMMTNCITLAENNDNAISITNGTFGWGQTEQTTNDNKTPTKTEVVVADAEEFNSVLKNINLDVNKGQFIAIVGDVGSGKSSLLQAILGEMLYQENTQSDKPKITIDGSLAYVSQSAWIQNATLKDNILFGQPFDEQRYKNALKFSCLNADVKILSKGDQTMIGEKGVNLSGGQKARISLARAIYSDKDIYLLDDPISAVDVHVGKLIMHECLNGYLKNKTRILVTHAINFTQYCDYIYIMDSGSIVEQGVFQDLKTSERFEKIYKKFFKSMDESEDTETKDDENQMKPLPVLTKQQSSVQKVIPETTIKDEVDDLMLMEDRAQGGITRNTYFQYLKWNGVVPVSIVMFMMLLWMSCYVGSSVWIAYWSEQSSQHEEVDNVYFLEIYMLFGIGQGVIAFLRTWILCILGVNSANLIHKRMMNCLIYAPMCQFFERVPLGQVLNRFTKDQNTLDTELLPILSWVLISVGQLICNIGLNVYASTYYILIPIIIYLSIGLMVQKVYIKASRELFRLEAMSRSPILSYFTEAVSGLPTIRAFGKQDIFMVNHGKNYDNNRKLSLEQIATTVWFSLNLGLSSFIVNLSSIIFCVFFSTKNPSLAGILLTYASTLDSNVAYTVEAASMVENSMVAFERCLAYTKIKPEKAYENLVDAIQSGNKSYREPKLTNWPSKGEIQYKNYSVRYREGLQFALKNINITIGQNEKIGVVGRTGAGKSTITLTLLRILEGNEGQIQIDGVNIATLSLQQVRQSITMIMQDSTIFNGTIRENVDPLNERTDSEIMEAIDKCCLKNLVEARNGLDAKLDGTNLSVGEKQLVCIARAVLRKIKIVLIDEATASIDTETEHTIQETIHRAFNDCTVITIAHRINTILHCDKILVIDQGAVKEFGYTKDLLEQKNSLFYGIYQEARQEQKA